MSRIGNRVLSIPDNVDVVVSDNLVTVKGSKGTLTHEIPSVIKVTVEDKTVKVERINELKTTKQLHGTTNSTIKTHIISSLIIFNTFTSLFIMVLEKQ